MKVDRVVCLGIRALAAGGRSPHLIARDLGMNPSTVRAVIGIRPRPYVRRRKLSPEQRIELSARYRGGGVTIRAVAAEFGCSYGTARSALRESGALRPRWPK